MHMFGDDTFEAPPFALGEQLLTVRERFRQMQTADPLARDQVPELPPAM